MEENYTICLPPLEKTRYIAGWYDKENNTPLYTYDILILTDAKRDVEVKQYLHPSGNKYKWGYEFHNKSQYHAFISIYKDGVLIPIVF